MKHNWKHFAVLVFAGAAIVALAQVAPSFVRSGILLAQGVVTAAGWIDDGATITATAGRSVVVSTTLPAWWDGIAVWGDSFTSGNQDASGITYPNVITGASGRATYNGGVGGETCAQISVRFMADTTYRGGFVIFEAGRNNADYSTAVACIQAMVAALPTPKRYLVLSIPNGNYPTEWSGTATYNAIIAANTALAAAFPSHYFDWRAYLIAQSPGTAEDVIDVAHGVPPSSFRAVDNFGTLNGAIADTSTCSIPLTPLAATTVPGVGSTLTVDTEKIFISALSGNSITGCTRGYASTSAATHLTGASYTALDPLHFSGAGYTSAGNYMSTWIAANDTGLNGRAVVSQDIDSFLATPPVIGNTTPNDGHFAKLYASELTGDQNVAPATQASPTGNVSSPFLRLYGRVFRGNQSVNYGMTCQAVIGSTGANPGQTLTCQPYGSYGSNFLLFQSYTVQGAGYTTSDNHTAMDANGIQLRSANFMCWSSTGNYYDTCDTKILRRAAGVAKVTQGYGVDTWGVMQAALPGSLAESKPTCSATPNGTTSVGEGSPWYTKGSGGSNGVFEICQNQSGAYSWVTH